MSNDAEAVALLEGRYSQRALHFTVVFEGLEPLQAFGRIDGKRFYFRLRGKTASLVVGHYDRDVEVQKAAEQNERFRNIYGNGLVIKVPDEKRVDLHPSVVEFASSFELGAGDVQFPEGLTGLAGIFAALVDSLAPVKTPA